MGVWPGWGLGGSLQFAEVTFQDVLVGVTDTTSFYFEKHFALFDLGNGHFFDGERLLDAIDDGGFHSLRDSHGCRWIDQSSVLVRSQCRESADCTKYDQRKAMLSPCPPLCIMPLDLGQLCKLLVSCGRRTSVIQTSRVEILHSVAIGSMSDSSAHSRSRKGNWSAWIVVNSKQPFPEQLIECEVPS
jgi:hypothetical protein